jgi:hypothetical protein
MQSIKHRQTIDESGEKPLIFFKRTSPNDTQVSAENRIGSCVSAKYLWDSYGESI